MPEGMYFEDFVKENRLSTNARTVTEADLVTFTTLCGFYEPLFMDAAYVASETPYRKRIVPGAMTFSFAEGLTILTGILNKTGMASLGVQIEVLKPVFIGDTLHVEVDVIQKRETRKPDRGIVAFRHRVINQDSVPVMEYEIKRMIKRKQG